MIFPIGPALAVEEPAREERMTLRPTLNHPFYVQGRGWVAACDLNRGDRLRTREGYQATVARLTPTGQTVPVFNLEVPRQHTYFVASDPKRSTAVLVHNQSPAPAKPMKFRGDPYDPYREMKRRQLEPVIDRLAAIAADGACMRCHAWIDGCKVNPELAEFFTHAEFQEKVAQKTWNPRVDRMLPELPDDSRLPNESREEWLVRMATVHSEADLHEFAGYYTHMALRERGLSDLALARDVNTGDALCAAVCTSLVSMIPGFGELDDACTIIDPEVSWGMKILAIASIGLNAVSLCAAPNFSSIRRATVVASDGVGVERSVLVQSFGATLDNGPSSLKMVGPDGKGTREIPLLREAPIRAAPELPPYAPRTALPANAQVSSVGRGVGGHQVIDRVAGEAQGALSQANRILESGAANTRWSHIYQRYRGTGGFREFIARRNALHQEAERLLIDNPYILEAQDAGFRIVFNRGSRLGATSSKGNLLRPDIQIGAPDGRYGIIDWTTEGSAGKIFKYGDPADAPWLINVTLP